jgi:hypothetical protein
MSRRTLGALAREAFAREEEADGTRQFEIEYVYYGKIIDPAILDRATLVEDQEQWEIKIPKTDKNATSGRQRIRKVHTVTNSTVSPTPKYELTTKIQLEQADPSGQNRPNVETEITVEASPALFEVYERMAECGMHKRRYTVPIPNSDLSWQIDRFYQADGTLSAWCKIDIEVKRRDQAIPQEVPGLDHLITNQKGFQTDEERAQIQELYTSVFLMQNKFVRAVAA